MKFQKGDLLQYKDIDLYGSELVFVMQTHKDNSVVLYDHYLNPVLSCYELDSTEINELILYTSIFRNKRGRKKKNG